MVVDARFLGGSSQGGFLLKVEDVLRLKEGDVLTVIREGRAIGYLDVRTRSLDGIVQVVPRFDGTLNTADTYRIGEIPIGTPISATSHRPSGPPPVAASQLSSTSTSQGSIQGPGPTRGSYVVKFQSVGVRPRAVVTITRGSMRLGEAVVISIQGSDAIVLALAGVQAEFRRGDVVVVARQAKDANEIVGSRSSGMQTQYGRQQGFGYRLLAPENRPDLRFEDSVCAFQFAMSEYGINVSMRNKTQYAIKIDWNELSFVDYAGTVHKVAPGWAKVDDASKVLPPTVVPPGSTLNEWVFPADHISYNSNAPGYSTAGGGRVSPLFSASPASAEGRRISLYIPLGIDGRTRPMRFEFSVYRIAP